MNSIVDFLLDRSNATLLIFTAVAAIAWIFSSSPKVRAAAGLAGLIASLFIPLAHRSIFEWAVTAIERPSAPGLLLMIVFAASTVTGRNFRPIAEFRFGTAMLLLGGVLLYPGAVGFLNYDTYVLGYSGYVLPALIAVMLGYAVYRRYFLVALALNVAILGFLLGAGRSLNLWDYVIDPVAWAISIGAWIGILIDHLLLWLRPPAPAPSSDGMSA